MAANTVLRLDSTTKTFAVDKAPPYAYTINYSDGSSADHQVRFFTPLLTSGAQYYNVNTPPVFNAGFEVEMLIAGLIQGDKRLFGIYSGSGGGGNQIFTLITRSDGGLGVFTRGSGGSKFMSTSNVNVLDGKLRKLNLVYDDVGGTLKIFSNGALILNEALNTNQVPDLTNILIMKFGAGEDNDFSTFTGYLADLKVKNAGTLVIDSPIDKQYTAAAPTVINKADVNNPLTAVNLNNAGQPFTLNAAGTIWNGSDGTTTLEIA